MREGRGKNHDQEKEDNKAEEYGEAEKVEEEEQNSEETTAEKKQEGMLNEDNQGRKEGYENENDRNGQ